MLGHTKKKKNVHLVVVRGQIYSNQLMLKVLLFRLLQNYLKICYTSVNNVCVLVCVFSKRGDLMIGLDSPSLRDCAEKQRVVMVTVKGEGGGCVCGVVLEVARWTLAGRLAGERAMRSVVLCHSCCSPSLCFPSLPVSRFALLLSS